MVPGWGRCPALLQEEDKLVISAGKRSFTLTFTTLQEYMGNRGNRGKKLPRGFQKVTDVMVEQNGEDEPEERK